MKIVTHWKNVQYLKKNKIYVQVHAHTQAHKQKTVECKYYFTEFNFRILLQKDIRFSSPSERKTLKFIIRNGRISKMDIIIFIFSYLRCILFEMFLL